MDDLSTAARDEQLMRRCFDLAVESARRGGYPFASIVTRKGRTIIETTNRVSHDGDVTRHAEIVAISEAQRRFGCTSLDDCTLYANIEPCALCSYAIRETRISKVMFGLSSPIMGGYSRWNILGDLTLSAAIPEVFAPPPEIHANFLSGEADATLRRASPILWAFARSRGLFICQAGLEPRQPLAERRPRNRTAEKAMRFMRRRVFDHFGGRGSR
jgi:tRNA(adenine34) deaminase